MNTYKCDTCNKDFTTKNNLVKHIKNKSCKMVKMLKFMCKCGKSYATMGNLVRHQCKCAINIDDMDNINNINNINCNQCDEFNHHHDNHHYDNQINSDCEDELIEHANGDDKIYSKADLAMINELKEGFAKEIKALKNEIIGLRYGDITIVNDNKKTINNINNTVNNIVVVTYGAEDMSKIDRNAILACINKGPYRSALQLTDVVHFDPNHPENHNIYISNMKNKYAMEYKNNQWNMVIKSDLIDKIYRNKKEYIEENIEQFYDSLSEKQIDRLHEWLKNDEDDEEKKRAIKEEICLLLFNKRKTIKTCI